MNSPLSSWKASLPSLDVFSSLQDGYESPFYKINQAEPGFVVGIDIFYRKAAAGCKHVYVFAGELVGVFRVDRFFFADLQVPDKKG